jgi:phage tail-like protein
VENNQLNYPVGFYFKLTFKGEEVAFKEVSGIANVSHLDEVVEGGENRFKYQLPGSQKYENIVLKRALVLENSKFLNWCNNILNGSLNVPLETNDILLSLNEVEGKAILEWRFFKAYPVDLAFEAFDTDKKSIAIERVAFSYANFEIVKK